MLRILTVALLLASVGQAFAEARLRDLENAAPLLEIEGTISKDDGDYVAKHEADFKNRRLRVFLMNSDGGDVGAAMKIGQIVRSHEGGINVFGKCFSSCALIYIAGVRRENNGWIGLHRPYLAAEPLSREQIEQAAPLMLGKIREYVRAMGVSDAFYDAMVNTEVSDIRRFRFDEINKLVPKTDPIYDEIENSYSARRYGVSAAEMRRRESEVNQACQQRQEDLEKDLEKEIHRLTVCSQSIYWGLDQRTYEERAKKALQNCRLSDDEYKIARATDIKKQRDLPFNLRRAACEREVMLGRK
jgi:hypothetical protein